MVEINKYVFFIQKLLTEHVLCRVRARVFIVNQTDSFLSPESLQLRWEVGQLNRCLHESVLFAKDKAQGAVGARQ